MIKAVIFDVGGVVSVRRYGSFYLQIVYTLRDILSRFTDQKGRLQKYIKAYGLTHKIDEGVLNIINKLKSAGYMTPALSNATIEKLRAYEALGLDKHLTPLLVSAELGFEKPDTGVFELAAQKLGVKPNECVFVDDRKQNVEGAIDAGFKGVVFQNADKLREELKVQGVKIA